MPPRLAARVPVTVIVLTFNEAANLHDCLTSVSGWASDVLVVDSGSTDETTRIAERHRARVLVHPFETHAKQWAWALQSLPFTTSWVLGLDADQRLTAQLREEIARRLSPEEIAGAPNGFFLRRRQVFRGRWIKHGGYYPKYLLKLFRREHVSLDTSELVDHHFHVRGRLDTLGSDIIEDNQNEAAIATWTAKHNHYATLQAREELATLRSSPIPPLSSVFRSPDARTRWLKHVWSRLPLFVRPCLYVSYRYVIRLGFLDGKEGFIFHVLQGFWYRLLVDVNIDELQAAELDARRAAESSRQNAV